MYDFFTSHALPLLSASILLCLAVSLLAVTIFRAVEPTPFQIKNYECYDLYD